MYQNQVGEAKLNKWEDNINDKFTIIQNIAFKNIRSSTNSWFTSPMAC